MQTSRSRTPLAGRSSAPGEAPDEPPPQSRTIRVASSAIHGRGVFARRDIRKGEVVIDNPALPLGEGEARDGDVVSFYCFEWPLDGDGRAIVLGEGSLLNHAPDTPDGFRGPGGGDGALANLSWRTDTRHNRVVFVAKRDIAAGEECLIDYGEDYPWDSHG